MHTHTHTMHCHNNRLSFLCPHFADIITKGRTSAGISGITNPVAALPTSDEATVGSSFYSCWENVFMRKLLLIL